MPTTNGVSKPTPPSRRVLTCWLYILYGWKQLKQKFNEKHRTKFSNDYIRKVHPKWLATAERPKDGWTPPKDGWCQATNGKCATIDKTNIKPNQVVHNIAAQHGLVLSIVLCIMLYLYFCVIIFI